MSILITKADGTVEPFQVQKLRDSLRRAGAGKDEIEDIVLTVSDELTEGMTTHEIYRRAFTLLRKSAAPVRARYSLRRALFGLGPTGFPFETFLAQLFAAEGYTTGTGTVLQGHCAEHEIDVTAYNKERSFVAEAKFHSRPGIKSDLQVAMYCYARLLDLKGRSICSKDVCGITDFMIITNTKFTSTAERYAECVGLSLLSWDYPHHDNLHDRIQRARVYPITVLQNLSNTQVDTLISRGVILCRDLTERPHILRHLHISTKKTEAILAEVTELCQRHEQ